MSFLYCIGEFFVGYMRTTFLLASSMKFMIAAELSEAAICGFVPILKHMRKFFM